MHELRTPPARAEREVVLLGQHHRQPARGRVERDAGAGHAAADRRARRPGRASSPSSRSRARAVQRAVDASCRSWREIPVEHRAQFAVEGLRGRRSSSARTGAVSANDQAASQSARACAVRLPRRIEPSALRSAGGEQVELRVGARAAPSQQVGQQELRVDVDDLAGERVLAHGAHGRDDRRRRSSLRASLPGRANAASLIAASSRVVSAATTASTFGNRRYSVARETSAARASSAMVTRRMPTASTSSYAASRMRSSGIARVAMLRHHVSQCISDRVAAARRRDASLPMGSRRRRAARSGRRRPGRARACKPRRQPVDAGRRGSARQHAARRGAPQRSSTRSAPTHVRSDAAVRVRHTRGWSTPDLLKLRSGDASDAPDAVVFPGIARRGRRGARELRTAPRRRRPVRRRHVGRRRSGHRRAKGFAGVDRARRSPPRRGRATSTRSRAPSPSAPGCAARAPRRC